MTEFLVRRFVRNAGAVGDPSVRAAYGSLAGAVGIAVNLLLFLAKLAVGVMTASVSVTADAFNNLSDAASSVTSYIGARIAARPADEEHPFGHGRVEYIAALIVAFLVLQVGFTLFKTSVAKLLHPEALSVSGVSVCVLLGSVLVKLWLSSFNRTLGNRIRSGVMLATAADARSDAMATGATLFSLLVFYGTGLNLDGACGLLVSFLVLKAGVGIAKDTLEPIIGEQMDPERSDEIMGFVRSYEGVLGVHDLILHNYGPSAYIASIHVELDSSMSLDEAHALLDRIEIDAKHRLHLLLVTHTDPIDLSDPETIRVRELVQKTAEAADPLVSCHDVRMVHGAHGANVVFDLVIPWKYTEAETERVIETIRKAVGNLCADYHCIITVEHGYGASCG